MAWPCLGAATGSLSVRLERRKDGAHVSERLVESSNIGVLRVKEFGTMGVEANVTQFMARHVGALTREDGRSPDRLVEEGEALTVVVRVQALASIQVHRELWARLPARNAEDRRPEVGSAASASAATQ
jgi:hypothetical protein